MGGTPAPDFDRGRRIAKYEILTRLSVGGMAELYLAYLPGPGGFKKFVAVKQILPDIKADDAFVKMFLDEARITAAFNHANIGQVFDLGEDDQSGELYLAMEFIAGQNLEQVIKRAAKREVPIPVGFAARVVRDACLGLHYAHTFRDPTGQPMAVVHRDVSPKNVMVTYTGQVKMIDFGIAKARGRLNRTQIGIVKGTSGYMSPEQVRNEALDGRTDLFAAGVMLHEMLCGERLFTATTDAAMMIKIVEEDPQDPTAVNPAIAPAFAQVVLKTLSKDRNARFASGKDLARAIEQSCPELFDDEQLGEVMGQLFEDKIALTRSLLELANDDAQDVARISRAVQGLTTGEEAEGRARKTGGVPASAAATPHPRPVVKSNGSSQRLPRVSSSTPAPARGKTPAPAPAKLSQRALPRVADHGKTSVAQTGGSNKASRGQLPEVREDVDSTIPPRRPSAMKLKPVEDDAPTPPRPAKVEQREAPPVEPTPVPKRGGGGVIGALFALMVIGGLVWAIGFGPLKEKALALLAQHTAEEPVVDTRPKALEPTKAAATSKPAWLVEKEAADALAAEERARQKAIEEASNDPERQKLLADIQAQLTQLNSLEEEQRALKVEAKQGRATGERNTRKIDELQKQIDELKKILADKQGKASVAPAKPKSESDAPLSAGQVQVVRDVPSAKRHDVGFLTLRTTNPASAAVYYDETALGSSPLAKVPLDVGVHKLRVVDSDSRNRVLSVTIEAGKTLQLTADVASLPVMP